MSWNAYLETKYDNCPACGRSANIERHFDQNYTHNTNEMIVTALKDLGMDTGFCWWDAINGKTGMEAATILTKIIGRLESEPGRFKAMNPPNGWGSYETLLPILRNMRNASLKFHAAVWRVNG